MVDLAKKSVVVTKGNIVFDDEGKKVEGKKVNLPSTMIAKLKKAGVVK